MCNRSLIRFAQCLAKNAYPTIGSLSGPHHLRPHYYDVPQRKVVETEEGECLSGNLSIAKSAKNDAGVWGKLWPIKGDSESSLVRTIPH